ncbi:hypothetical protein AAII07_54320 [Microvirga sp. 0TCS3.31]
MSGFTAFVLKEMKPREGELGEPYLVGNWGGVYVVIRPDPDQEQGEKHRRWIVTFRSRDAAVSKQRRQARRRARDQAAESKPPWE